jgi:hypothetical protein
MNSITSIYIPFVEIDTDADYIIESFYCNNIATIRSVTFVVDKKNRRNAFIDIAEWHETETAYNFVNSLRNPNRETRFVHHDDDWWVVDINNDHHITHSPHTYVNHLAALDTNVDIYIAPSLTSSFTESDETGMDLDYNPEFDWDVTKESIAFWNDMLLAF